MSAEDIRVRSLYLFLACVQAVERVKDRLLAAVPSMPESIKPLFEKSLKRELGLLFRYWATRQIWQRLETNELDARNLNLALLRLFFEGLRLPKDGSGLRYAELSSLSEEMEELTRRVKHAPGMPEQPSLLQELQQAIVPCRSEVMTCTADALELPLEQLSLRIRAWSDRVPEAR